MKRYKIEFYLLIILLFIMGCSKEKNISSLFPTNVISESNYICQCTNHFEISTFDTSIGAYTIFKWDSVYQDTISVFRNFNTDELKITLTNHNGYYNTHNRIDYKFKLSDEYYSKHFSHYSSYGFSFSGNTIYYNYYVYNGYSPDYYKSKIEMWGYLTN